jgi:hypothetical protein
VKKHFVTFYSPGTFVSESTEKEIDSWDVEVAKEMARNFKKRHGATPYGFRFSTRERGENDLDSKTVAKSGMYFLGGKVRHLDFIILENNPDERILISNMKNNGWDRVVENCNSYKITQPLEKDDVVLDWTP